jgi:hypothetical protein
VRGVPGCSVERGNIGAAFADVVTLQHLSAENET